MCPTWYLWSLVKPLSCWTFSVLLSMRISNDSTRFMFSAVLCGLRKINTTKSDQRQFWNHRSINYRLYMFKKEEEKKLFRSFNWAVAIPQRVLFSFHNRLVCNIKWKKRILPVKLFLSKDHRGLRLAAVVFHTSSKKPERHVSICSASRQDQTVEPHLHKNPFMRQKGECQESESYGGFSKAWGRGHDAKQDVMFMVHGSMPSPSSESPTHRARPTCLAGDNRVTGRECAPLFHSLSRVV